MKNILVIDDDPILNHGYCSLLKEIGYKSFSANSAFEGLKILKENTPDGIILDLNMPKMDGIAFLENANVAQDYPATKVLVFSVIDDDERIERAFELGASRYIVKTMLSPKDFQQIITDEI